MILKRTSSSECVFFVGFPKRRHQDVHTSNRKRGEKTLKEALDRIAQAEAANELAQADLEKKLTKVRQDKEQALTALTEKLKAERSQALREKEEAFSFDLKNEREALLADAQTDRRSFQENYDRTHEAIVAEIIERVKGTYGS